MTILIIDDEGPLRETLRDMLETLGYNVREAENGDAGMATLQLTDIALIITDILMPKKDGIETIHEIRSLYPSLPIVAISGGGVNRDMSFLAYASKLGANRVLQKPIGFQDLANTVEALVPLHDARIPNLFRS
ncbi:response regulator [Algihabitans albus]|uniref:response regulator n=1 Tax=Algihabitans albus TaxID=2164067 RepID=UPI001ABC84DA|nr:response regulator [Algihabitans albus]